MVDYRRLVPGPLASYYPPQAARDRLRLRAVLGVHRASVTSAAATCLPLPLPDFGARPRAGTSSPVFGFIVKRPWTVHCFPSQLTVALTGTSLPFESGQL